MEAVIDWMKEAIGLKRKTPEDTLKYVTETLTNKVKELEDENIVLARENIALRRGNEKLVFRLRFWKDGGGDRLSEDQFWDYMPYLFPPQENASFLDRLRNFLLTPATKVLLQENEFLKSENEDLVEELKAAKSEITQVKKSFCFY